MHLKLDPRRLAGRVFPIVGWAGSYDLRTGIGDLIAGITVALTLIPQSIAYASLAGFEPQYGLYASLTGGFIYGVMGTIPQINIGPTALLSLLTFTYTNGTNPDFAVLLCFIGGIVQLIAGISQLGFLVDIVSTPVVSGFTSAAAITIASSQIKGLLGLKFDAETFVSTWRGVLHNITGTRLQDTLLGLSCCIVLMGMKALKDIRIKDQKDKSHTVLVQRVLWFTGVSRNAVVVVMASLIAFFLHQDKNTPFILTGNITPGLPKPQFPAFHSTIGNATIGVTGMFSQLGSGLLVVPLVGVISNVAIAKAFSKGKTLDATQEIVSLGICNIIGSFFRSFPVNGSFTRSAVSDASGVRTPAAGFYTGVVVVLTLALLTPYFYFIPRAALAAVIMCAVLHMVDVDILKQLWRTNRLDLIPLLGTFVSCLLLGIEVGLGCGVAIDVLLLLYYQSRPTLDIRYVHDGILPPHYAMNPIGGLHFASAERVRSKLISLKNKDLEHSVDIVTVSPNGSTPTTTIPNGSSTTSNIPNGLNATSNMPNGLSHTTLIPYGLSATLPNGCGAPTVWPKLLVVYCDALTRVDFTFLQSIKMIVREWSHDGYIFWCDANPLIREQLSSVLREPLFCDNEQLRTLLLGISTMTQTGSVSDTHL